MNSEDKDMSNTFESLAIQDILHELSGQLQMYSSIASKSGESEDGSSSSEEEGDEYEGLQSGESEIHNLAKKKVKPKVQRTENRLKDDIAFLLDTLSQTKSELETRNSFHILQTSIEEEKGRQNSESILINKVKRKETEARELQRELSEFEQTCRLQEREQLCLLNNLRDEVHLAKQRGKADTRFATVWLTARNEYEKGVRNKDEVSDKRALIKEKEMQINRDCDAFENVTAWTKLASAEIQKKIEGWKQKFADDTKTMERKVEIKRKVIEEQEERIRTLETTIAERIEELIPWEEEKEQEKRERIHHMRRYYSCRNIQRWWRKQMVQHGLYKKPKKKPKPKTKGKPPKNRKK